MKVAVAGGGYWGANLIRVLHQLGVLHSICDFSSARLEQLAQTYPDVAMETSYERLLGDDADAVVISTPALVNGQFVAGKPTARPIEFPADESLRLECQHFLECIASRQRPKTDGEDGWRVLKVLEASQRSLNLNGEPVQLETRRVYDIVRA